MSSSTLTPVPHDGRMDPSQPRFGGPTRRRSFTPAQKLEHLAAYEAALTQGHGGAYLRQQGLYSSQITWWRRLRDGGVLAGKSAGAKVGRPTLAPADLPARTPPSRSLRHQVIWEEYSPCWRRYAPPWPWVRAASYAARCSSFCAGVNDRRRVGPPKRGCEGSIRPSWGTGVSVEELIRNQSESRPAWDGLAMNRWPQLTLARRDDLQ